MFGNMASDLATLQGVFSIAQKVIGPACLIFVGGTSLLCLFRREYAKFVSILGLGAVILVTIYAAPSLMTAQIKMEETARNVSDADNANNGHKPDGDKHKHDGNETDY